MHDLLRANGLRSYGGRSLAIGEEFIVESKFTPALLKLGTVILVTRDVQPPDQGALLRPPRKAPKPKRRYRTRALTAER